MKCVKVSLLRSQKHPIYYEGFNLCELSQQNKLKNFIIDILVRICEHFELDIAIVSRQRKEGFLIKSKSSLEVATAICNCFS